MKIAVYNKEGKETGKSVELNDSIFGIEPNDHAIYLDVKQYLANQRQGTHKAKEKFEVNYSTKKIKKQKGTGGARAGSIKSGVFVGGGRIFGPRPRDYFFKLNKKLKRLARVSALAYKAKNNEIVIVENFNFEAPNTKSYADVLNNLKLTDSRTLVVTPEMVKNVYLSSRNLSKTQVLPANEINTYQIMKAKKLVIFDDAISKIEEILNN